MSNKKNTITFTKELFIETMSEIEKQYKHDIECAKAFGVILPNDYITGYNNDRLLNQLVKILQIAMNDNNKEGWIEYYMWELDFGKKYHEGSIIIYGEDFELKNASDLWDLLHI